LIKDQGGNNMDKKYAKKSLKKK